MRSMTHRQAELLAYITQYQANNQGISPSFEEMKETLGLHSKSGVHRLISALEERGLLYRKRNRARCISILKQPEISGLEAFSSAALIAELSRRRQAKLAA